MKRLISKILAGLGITIVAIPVLLIALGDKDDRKDNSGLWKRLCCMPQICWTSI